MESVFFLMSILGISLLGTFFSNDDSGEDDNGEIEAPEPDYPAPEDVAPPETDRTIAPNGESAQINDRNDHQNTHYILQNGSNELRAGSGDDYIQTGTDYNSIDAGAGNDLIETQDGRDTISGGAGEDTLLGGDGIDLFRDTEGSSLVFAGGGNDFISVAGGSTVTGGEGADRIELNAELGSTDPIIITDFNSDEDSVRNIYLSGTSDTGGELEVVDWEDGEGADIFYGTTHIAHVHGGQGLELVSETNGDEDEVTFSLSVSVDADGAFTDGDGETVIRSSGIGASTINGGGGDDHIDGGSNVGDTPEELNGGDGNDTIIGVGANDEYSFGPATQTTYMNGGAGDDIIISDHETVLTGGTGADIFGIGGNQPSNLYEAPVITDFDPSEDMIMVERYYDDPDNASTGDFTIRVWDDGTGADVMDPDGVFVVVSVVGGQSLTGADIAIASIDVQGDLLGYH